MASIASALATLAAAGIDVSAMQEELLTASANEVFERKCVTPETSIIVGWQTEMFELAASVSDGIKSEVKTVQGGATRKVHLFGIDTPHGHLTVSLKSEVQA